MEPPEAAADCSDANNVITGTGGADTLVGRDDRRDEIKGFGGQDVLRGKARGDCLRGHDGADELWGGDGVDELLAGEHADELYGGIGPDEMQGGLGNDYLSGSDGNDHLFGGSGSDVLNCGAGWDTAHADASDTFVNSDCEVVTGLPCTPNLPLLRVSNCDLARSDTGSGADPIPLWGYRVESSMQLIDCATNQQHTLVTTGGDTHLRGDGAAQGNSSYRSLTALDDKPLGSSERCELGRNTWRYGENGGTTDPSGTFALYEEGDHRVTFISIRLTSAERLALTNNFQNVMQMKQANPSNNGGTTPVLHLAAYNDTWELRHSQPVASGSSPLWSTPAQSGVWTRFAFDVKYSKDPDLGAVKVYVDLNGDGDAQDANEQSPVFTTNTLKEEIAGPETLIAPGEPIPSHLRVGTYHDTDIACPAPSGCATDVDNVQVFDLP